MPDNRRILPDQTPEKKGLPKKAGISNARRLLNTHLGWIGGFPQFDKKGNFHWRMPLDANEGKFETNLLTTNHLNKATQTVNKLKRDFPRALPRIVGDIHAWEMRVKSLIGWLQLVQQNNQPLPVHLFSDKSTYPKEILQMGRKLEKEHPQLLPLLSTLSWRYYIRSETLTKILQSISSNPKVYKNWLELNLVTTVQVCHLFILENQNFDPVLNILERGGTHTMSGPETTRHLAGWEGTHRIVTSGGTSLAQAMGDLTRNVRGYPENPNPIPNLDELSRNHEVTWSRELKTFISWLTKQNSDTRKQTLSLVALIDLASPLNQWRMWWREQGIDLWNHIGSLFFEVRRRQQCTTPEQLFPWEQAEERCRKLAESAPSEFDIAKFLGTVQVLARVPKHIQQAIGDTIALLPNEPSLKVEILDHFYNLWTRYKRGVLHYFKGFQAYLKLSNDSKALSPWIGRWKLLYCNPDHYLLREVKPGSKIEEIFECVSRIHAQHEQGLDDDEVENLWPLLKVGFSVEQTVAIALLFRQSELLENSVSDEILQFAKELESDATQTFMELVRILDIQQENFVVKYLIPTFQVFREGGHSALFRDLVLEGYWKTPRFSQHQLVFLQNTMKKQHLSIKGPNTRCIRKWMQLYPAAFREILEKLASVEPKAENIASSILSTDFPDPNEIKQELQSLVDKIPQASEKRRPQLIKRQTTLTSRLDSNSLPSPKRLGTLHTKLERAFKHAVVQSWERSLDSSFLQEWPRFLGTKHCPPWLLEPATLEVLLPIIDLKKSHRALAIHLITVRTNDPPWDLRDDPANQRFLHAMSQQKIHTKPWVNGVGTMEYHTTNGKTCLLTLEDDPLDIFRMGAHFQTCLSPGAFNFFSVFSNAADINKRVLYGRDLNGKIIGRTLLALTDQGGLVVFHIYCHDHKMGYPEAVSKFVKLLAERMRTIIVPSGTVSSLVSDDWYDDGPIDLGCSFPALKEGSDFRNQLHNLDPQALLLLIKEAFSPIPLNELTIPLLLELPEILENKKFALPLIDLVSNYSQFPLFVYMKTLRMALHAGLGAYAFSQFGKHFTKGLLQEFRYHGEVYEKYLEMVVQCDPSEALMLLKRTRSKGIRNWEDEKDEDRRKLIIQALTLLGRPQQAEDLLKGYR